jgi:cytochrome c556
VVLAVAAVTGSRPTADESTTRPDQVAVFMRAKLAHSQNVLEGLAVEDYDLIDKGAQELSLASEDASWQVLQTEDYARQSADFRRSCDSLRKAAKSRNLDGAALAWMEVTMKCVQCHKYVRDVRDEP